MCCFSFCLHFADLVLYSFQDTNIWFALLLPCIKVKAMLLFQKCSQ
jgi:hypothetical protein